MAMHLPKGKGTYERHAHTSSPCNRPALLATSSHAASFQCRQRQTRPLRRGGKGLGQQRSAQPADGVFHAMKEQFFVELEKLIAEARRLLVTGFSAEQKPEEETKQSFLEPLFRSLGIADESNMKREFKIGLESVDYLIKSDRPLLFVEAKSLHDCLGTSLFDKYRDQVHRYIHNYRLSPEITKVENPVKWILLANFAQFHFIRVNENNPTFSFRLDDLWAHREELWEMLALENLEANRLDELYDEQLKAGLDQQFLADLKRWRLLIANGFALRNQKRSLEDITLASQQLLDRFIFCRMLETRRLVAYNKLARAYSDYWSLYERADANFSEIVRHSLFIQIKKDFNTELFDQPLLCDEMELDNEALAAVIGHEPIAPELAATCGFDSAQGEPFAFRHLYNYDFSLMTSDVMGAVYERFLAHKLFQKGGRIVIEDTNELRKKEGVYYTPQYIAEYIVQHTLGEKIKTILAGAKTLLGYKNFKGAFAKIRELADLKVLDPAMGSGSLLLRAFDTLIAAYADYNAECRLIKKERNGHDALFDADFAVAEEVLHAPLHVLTENIFGVDLDKQAVEVAKLNLWLRYMVVNRDEFIERIRRKKHGDRPLNLLPKLTMNLKRGNSLIADKKVAGDAAFDWAVEYPEIMQRGGFDVIISNPPYERIQVMQANAPEAAEFLKANYRAAASGNFDIYVCFIERGLQLLNAKGFLGYICPHKFFQAEYGAPVRKLLSDGKHVREIVSFGDQQVFTQASTYTCLLFLEKAPQAQSHFIKVDDLDDWRATGAAACGKIAPAVFTSEPWNFVLGNGAELFARLNQNSIRLRDVAGRIAQGIRTSANPVYVLDIVSMNDSEITAFSEQLQREVKLERKSIAPFLQGQDIRRYALQHCSKVVVLPYQIKAGRAKLIAETQLRKEFPLTYDYLRQNKKLLEDREEGRMRGGDWYAFVYPKNLELMLSPKILVPDIANFSSFAFDEAGEFAFTSGYGITLKADAKESPPFLLGLLNSRLLDYYLKQVSTTLRGGYFRYFTQFIEQLPVKRIDPKNKRETKLQKEIVRNVEAIQAAHRQRVKLPEVLQRLIAHTQNRTPCHLAHYLQKDFVAAVKADILIDDVQRTGFVHSITVKPEGKNLTLIASVAETAESTPFPLPVLQMSFKDDPLRQFIYASWRHFLDEHSRQRRWTKGKKAEPVYSLLVNTLEPLVCFNPAASDNLRAIHDLMKAVAQEAGTADLAAVESEIKQLDFAIDAFVYELYGLTGDEIRIVETAAPGHPRKGS
jgi:type I restriction-modification system DNA methylase subunit